MLYSLIPSYQYHESRPKAAIAYACILHYCNTNIIHFKLIQEKEV